MSNSDLRPKQLIDLDISIRVFGKLLCNRLTGTLPRSEKFRLADQLHRAAHAIPLSRRSDDSLNFRLTRWIDAFRLFAIVAAFRAWSI